MDYNFPIQILYIIYSFLFCCYPYYFLSILPYIVVRCGTVEIVPVDSKDWEEMGVEENEGTSLEQEWANC